MDKYHPDRARDKPEHIREKYEKRIRLLNEAKEVLLDTTARSMYDYQHGYRQDVEVTEEEIEEVEPIREGEGKKKGEGKLEIIEYWDGEVGDKDIRPESGESNGADSISWYEMNSPDDPESLDTSALDTKGEKEIMKGKNNDPIDELSSVSAGYEDGLVNEENWKGDESIRDHKNEGIGGDSSDGEMEV